MKDGGKPPAEPEARSSRAGAKILVVDDEPSVLSLVNSILTRRGGHSLTLARNGEEAFHALTSAGPFDLVIADIRLPDASGEDVLRLAKDLYPSTPVIIMTAYKTDENVLHCFKLGASDYITKPFSVGAFGDAVQRVLALARKHAEHFGEISVEHQSRDWVEMVAPSDYEYVARFRRFTQQLVESACSREEAESIRVAVEELGQNAVEWGNRNDRSRMIRLSYCLLEDKIVFKVEDEGEGFDPGSVADPKVNPAVHIVKRSKSGKRPGGYGISMAKSSVDKIVYSPKGNVALFYKRLEKLPGLNGARAE